MDEQITTRDVAADEPCMCGKRTLKSWWESITDAGDEGTDRVRHSRVACLTQTERRRVAGYTIDDRPETIARNREAFGMTSKPSLAERIRELCAAQGSCGEAGCTAVATCDLLRVLDEETAR